MAQEIAEKERTKPAIGDSQQKITERIQQGFECKDTTVCLTDPSLRKMSDIILEYASPLLEVTKSAEEDKKAITLAIVFWNLSQFPEEERCRQMDMINSQAGDETFSGIFGADNSIADYMFERKQNMFSFVDRMVFDYDLVDTPAGIHLNVAYGLLKQDST